MKCNSNSMHFYSILSIRLDNNPLPLHFGPHSITCRGDGGWRGLGGQYLPFSPLCPVYPMSPRSPLSPLYPMGPIKCRM